MSKIPKAIKVKIAKMGNSLRMTIPTPIAWALDWKSGDHVEINVTNGEMIVKKAE